MTGSESVRCLASYCLGSAALRGGPPTEARYGLLLMHEVHADCPHARLTSNANCGEDVPMPHGGNTLLRARLAHLFAPPQ